MAYPSTLDSFLDPQPTDPCLWHADLHVAINTAIKAIQAKLWIDASAVTWTVDYLLKQAVSPWHTHVKTEVGLSNVTNNAQVKKISSSTNNQLVVWDWTTGDLLKDWPSYAETGAGKLALIKNTWLLDASLIDISGSTASQAEAEAWTDNTKLMTPLRSKQQLDANKASNSEAYAWANTSKYVTPFQASFKYATAYTLTTFNHSWNTWTEYWTAVTSTKWFIANVDVYWGWQWWSWWYGNVWFQTSPDNSNWTTVFDSWSISSNFNTTNLRFTYVWSPWVYIRWYAYMSSSSWAMSVKIYKQDRQ